MITISCDTILLHVPYHQQIYIHRFLYHWANFCLVSSELIAAHAGCNRPRCTIFKTVTACYIVHAQLRITDSSARLTSEWTASVNGSLNDSYYYGIVVVFVVITNGIHCTHVHGAVLLALANRSKAVLCMQISYCPTVILCNRYRSVHSYRRVICAIIPIPVPSLNTVVKN